MKKVIIILFILINVFAPLSFVSASASISISEKTATSVKFNVLGLTPNVDVIVYIKNDDVNTPSYSKYIQEDRDNNDGTLSNFNFIGLSPSGDYKILVDAGTIEEPSSTTRVANLSFSTPGTSTTVSTTTKTGTTDTNTVTTTTNTTPTNNSTNSTSNSGSNVSGSTTSTNTGINSTNNTPWYFTQTHMSAYIQPDGVQFINKNSKTECANERTTMLASGMDTTIFTISECREKITAPSGEGWVFNITSDTAPVLADNPVGFKTEEDCNTRRDDYMKTVSSTGVDLCLYKKGINNEGVVDITGVKSGDVYDPTYHLLAPIGNYKDIKTDEVGKYFDTIFLVAIGLCGVLSVIMIVVGGIMYMGGDSVFDKNEGKKKINNAIIGLLIALGSYALLNTINPDLLGGKGLTISRANIKLERTSGGGYFGGTIGDPSNPNVNKNITEWDPYLESASKKYGVSCTTLKAFMYAESSGVNTQTSPAKAKGLMQLMDDTFKEQGVGTDPMDPQTNINAGASYLSRLKNNGCNGSSYSNVCDISNIQYWAASYNGGPGANKEDSDPSCIGLTLWQCEKNGGYSETRIYAPRVEANYNKLIENKWGCRGSGGGGEW